MSEYYTYWRKSCDKVIFLSKHSTESAVQRTRLINNVRLPWAYIKTKAIVAPVLLWFRYAVVGRNNNTVISAIVVTRGWCRAHLLRKTYMHLHLPLADGCIGNCCYYIRYIKTLFTAFTRFIFVRFIFDFGILSAYFRNNFYEIRITNNA